METLGKRSLVLLERIAKANGELTAREVLDDERRVYLKLLRLGLARQVPQRFSDEYLVSITPKGRLTLEAKERLSVK